MFFVGEFERNVDANGRLTLPSDFRLQLVDTHCYLTRDNRGCLVITPKDDFESAQRIRIDQVNRGELPVAAKHAIGVRTTKLSVDRQGRFTLDEANRAAGDIDTSGVVIMVGALDTIEIWCPERFQVVSDELVADDGPRVWPAKTGRGPDGDAVGEASDD